MNTFFDESGLLNIDELIVDHPSFIRIMEDGKVTEEELKDQGERVAALLREIEKTASPEMIEQVRNLLSEISVLVAARNIYNKQEVKPQVTPVTSTPEQVYHCSECGAPIYRHEVFCSKCGKKLDHYDFE